MRSTPLPACRALPVVRRPGGLATRLSTEGRLWAWTAVQAAPPGYEGPVPYGFGVVELPADGLRIITLLTESDPEALHEGDAMAFTTVEVGEGLTAWAFAAPDGQGRS